MAATATYTKLRDGTWGIRVVGYCPSAGGTIEVAKRDGAKKVERISKTVWSGTVEGATVSLCAIERSSAPAAGRTSSGSGSPSRGRATGCRCGSREDASGQLVNRSKACWQCRHDDE